MGLQGLDLETVFQRAGAAIAVTDKALNVLLANPAYTELTGQTPGAGQLPLAGLPDSLRRSLTGEGCCCASPLHAQVQCSGADGRQRPAWVTVVPIRDAAGSVHHFVVTFTEIGWLLPGRNPLQCQVGVETLQRLPNRQALQVELARGLARARRRGQGMALLLVDLDCFKRINDELGRPAGDQVLGAVAGRMQEAVRGDDLVARLEGDAFVVLLNDLHSAQHASLMASALLAAIARPVQAGADSVQVTASIGVALFPDHAQSVDALLQVATAAMRLAKQQGRNGFVAGGREPP